MIKVKGFNIYQTILYEHLKTEFNNLDKLESIIDNGLYLYFSKSNDNRVSDAYWKLDARQTAEVLFLSMKNFFKKEESK